METIIQKAIEGGWEDTHQAYRSNSEANALAVIDPLFWQALGKACGWEEKTDYEVCVGPADNSYESYDKMWEYTWIYHAKVFYRINLTEGWDKAVEYLTTLVEKDN